MLERKKNCAIWFLFLFANLSLLTNSSGAQTLLSNRFDTERISWSHLSYTAENFFGTVTTDVHLATFLAGEIAKSLIVVPKGAAFQASSSTIFGITVDSAIDPLIGATEKMNSWSWYDLNTGIVLQRIRLRQGKEKWQKIYRFTNQGVYRLRKKPSSTDETNLPLERWTNSEGTFYPYSLSEDGCSRVVEPSVMLFLVSKMDLTEEASSLSLCVFGKSNCTRFKSKGKA